MMGSIGDMAYLASRSDALMASRAIFHLTDHIPLPPIEAALRGTRAAGELASSGLRSRRTRLASASRFPLFIRDQAAFPLRPLPPAPRQGRGGRARP